MVSAKDYLKKYIVSLFKSKGVDEVLAYEIAALPSMTEFVSLLNIKLLEILGRLKNIIVDRKVTSLRLIANPEAFSIQNLKRTYLLANLYDINVDLAIMNKVIPERVSDAYFKEWKKAQEK